jgi:hypothetical protein
MSEGGLERRPQPCRLVPFRPFLCRSRYWLGWTPDENHRHLRHQRGRRHRDHEPLMTSDDKRASRWSCRRGDAGPRAGDGSRVLRPMRPTLVMTSSANGVKRGSTGIRAQSGVPPISATPSRRAGPCRAIVPAGPLRMGQGRGHPTPVGPAERAVTRSATTSSGVWSATRSQPTHCGPCSRSGPAAPTASRSA